jgi:tRNA-splicing ligase RtcB
MDQLDHAIPRGLGRGALWRLTVRSQLEAVLADGSRYAVKRGHGTARDLERCEDQGALADAGEAAVSARAQQRGLGQLGSLGSGNHFLEVQAVEHVYDEDVAKTFGLTLAVTAGMRYG